MHRLVKSLCCTLALLTVAGTLQATLTDDLDVYFKLDENNGTSYGTPIINSGNNGQDGAIQALYAVNQPGMFGTCYLFNGTDTPEVAGNPIPEPVGDPIDNYIGVGTQVLTDYKTVAEVTYSAWIKPTFIRTGVNAASRHYIFGANTSIAVSISRGGAGPICDSADITFVYTTSGTNYGFTSSGPRVQLNEWSNIVCVRDIADDNDPNSTSTARIYLNGVQIYSSSTGGTGLFDVAGAGTLWMGTVAGIPARDFDGYIDDAAIWIGRALTDQDVALIHGLGRFAGVTLDTGGIDAVLAVYNAASGSAQAGGIDWQYTTGLTATLAGETGGSVGTGDAWIALDASGNGVQMVAASLHPGDANGDGMVNLADLQILGDNWQSTTASWAMADFTGDGNVNLADLQILGDNWGYGVGSDISFDEALAGLVVPEPAGVMLLSLGAVAMLRRRR